MMLNLIKDKKIILPREGGFMTIQRILYMGDSLDASLLCKLDDCPTANI